MVKFKYKVKGGHITVSTYTKKQQDTVLDKFRSRTKGDTIEKLTTTFKGDK